MYQTLERKANKDRSNVIVVYNRSTIQILVVLVVPLKNWGGGGG